MKKLILLLVPALFIAATQTEKSPHMGEALPEFTMLSAEGDTVSLSDYEGGTVMLFTLGYG